MTPSRQRTRARSWIAGMIALVLVAATGLVSGAAAATKDQSDMVLDWNLYAVQALSNPPTAVAPVASGAGQPPPVASIHLAMVQGAVYDAINAIDRRHEPYLRGLPRASRSASKPAAAATAAHHVLVGLVPALPTNVIANLDSLYKASLAEIRKGSAKTKGIKIGAAVAKAMLAKRADDGRYVPHSFVVGTEVGEWRPVLPGFVNDPFAWVADVDPFTLKRTSQFRTKGPFDLTSKRYAAEFNEVKALGAATGSTRTEAQTLLARFYSANPLPMMNQALREVAADRRLSISQQARLFGMSSFAGADAFINCWDDKEHWNFWRPITAIHQAEDDDNPATSPQADWAPLLATPPYPDHPSGYNCYTAAMMYSAKAFFGKDRIGFTLASPVTMTTRSYKRFTAVLKDTIDARVYLGIHFRRPDVQGAELGRNVAKWVASHYFERVH